MTGANNIVMRCDGGQVIGMGHVVRCLALAHALSRHGMRAVFATWSTDGAAADRIRAAGFPVECVGVCVPRHMPLDAADLKATIECARSYGAVAVLIDHYQADAEYFAGFAARGLRVAVIDDVADRDLRAVDWVLNQNPAARNLQYQVADGGTVLNGPAYALLRPGFAAARSELERKFSADDCHVLLTLGGSDVAKHMARLLAALEGVTRRLEIRCVLGGGADFGAVRRAATGLRHDVRVLIDVADMAEHMMWADVSINAGGSTCWELCCLGVPMVVIELSADQRQNVARLDEYRIAVSAGKWDARATPPAVAHAVENLLEDAPRRAAMSVRTMELVDGHGASRAAESFCALICEREGALR